MIDIIYFSVIIIIVFLVFLYFNKKRNMEAFVIKNVIDYSRIGIVVLNKKGEIVLENEIMFNFRYNNNINDNYAEKIKSICNEKVGKDYIMINDNEVYLFEFSNNNSYILRYDVTEEYMLHREIEEKNKVLEDNIEKTLWTMENMEEIEREKSLQKIKSKYHDIIGQNLSILHQYLINNKNSKEDIEDIKFMINKMFVDIEDTENPFLNLENLIKVHKNLGINIFIRGALPDDEEIGTVFFEIIREAVTNAIKHANSNKIDIDISNDSSNTIMTIKNNGRKPNETIIEHDGIRGMRKRVEKIHGKIFISTHDIFEIKVIV